MAVVRVEVRVPKLEFGEDVLLVGASTALGAWRVDDGTKMEYEGYGLWTADVALPCGTSIEFKPVIVSAAGREPIWLSARDDANFTLHTRLAREGSEPSHVANGNDAGDLAVSAVDVACVPATPQRAVGAPPDQQQQNPAPTAIVATNNALAHQSHQEGGGGGQQQQIGQYQQQGQGQGLGQGLEQPQQLAPSQPPQQLAPSQQQQDLTYLLAAAGMDGRDVELQHETTTTTKTTVKLQGDNNNVVSGFAGGAHMAGTPPPPPAAAYDQPHPADFADVDAHQAPGAPPLSETHDPPPAADEQPLSTAPGAHALLPETAASIDARALPAPPTPPPLYARLAVRVRFPGARTVEACGAWDDWQKRIALYKVPLGHKDEFVGEWGVHAVSEHDEVQHELKFIVDGEWLTSPSMPLSEDGTNNVVGNDDVVGYLPVFVASL